MSTFRSHEALDLCWREMQSAGQCWGSSHLPGSQSQLLYTVPDSLSLAAETAAISRKLW